MTGRDRLQEGREHELAGRLTEAAACYEDARLAAEQEQDAILHAEALRRLGVTFHRRGDGFAGREYTRRSHMTAMAAGQTVLARFV